MWPFIETLSSLLTFGHDGRYHSEDPRAFREGDVVEVSFSVMGVRIRDHKAMVFFNLRALTMIDDSIRKVSIVQSPLSDFYLTHGPDV